MSLSRAVCGRETRLHSRKNAQVRVALTVFSVGGNNICLARFERPCDACIAAGFLVLGLLCDRISIFSLHIDFTGGTIVDGICKAKYTSHFFFFFQNHAIHTGAVLAARACVCLCPGQSLTKFNHSSIFCHQVKSGFGVPSSKEKTGTV